MAGETMEMIVSSKSADGAEPGSDVCFQRGRGVLKARVSRREKPGQERRERERGGVRRKAGNHQSTCTLKAVTTESKK